MCLVEPGSPGVYAGHTCPDMVTVKGALVTITPDALAVARQQAFARAGVVFRVLDRRMTNSREATAAVLARGSQLELRILATLAVRAYLRQEASLLASDTGERSSDNLNAG